MDICQKTIHTIRTLAIDIVQKANSGHPGAPMGMAPMAYTLWADVMNHSPGVPHWVNRDRFVLSAGHASVLLYSLLHLFGYGITMEDLKQFRQWGSVTPGHPEYAHTVGVETTTGPLGQGIANAVGFAIAETMLAEKFNREGYPIVDHYTYALCGDGCMMEGVSAEAASLAGTLELGKLIVLYDDNEITIEGDTDIAFRENVPARFEAYGWHVQKLLDGNDSFAILNALQNARRDKRPSLIVVPTTIGFGCPAKAGKAGAHGEPLGVDNITATKEKLMMPLGDFEVMPEVYLHMEQCIAEKNKLAVAWQELFDSYCATYPELAEEWAEWLQPALPARVLESGELLSFEGRIATRSTSGTMINRLARLLPNLVGGSADLAPSNKTYINDGGDYSAENRSGRNLHFGVREHAMAAICNGMALHGGLRVFCATFFVFSDYMKSAMRMSALMKLPVTYVLTHDSIGVGEDGPTHQPIEQLAGLRAIPDLLVFRPADGKETAMAWWTALTMGLPTCLVLTRQDLPTLEGSGKAALQGGYVISDSPEEPKALLLASGSEVEPMLKAQKQLALRGISCRVVSMPCMELFDRQSKEYRESVLPENIRCRVSMEAGVSMPWYRYVGLDGKVIGIDHFGASAPAEKLFVEYGVTAGNAFQLVRELLEAQEFYCP